MATSNSALHTVQSSSIDVHEETRVAIVDTDWNSEVCENLKHASIKQMVHLGVQEDNILQHRVPGAFELPFAVKQLLTDGNDIDAVIAIGCVVRGETKHDEYLSQSVTSALMQLSLMSSKPIILGLLTCNTMDQAIARSGGKHGNKGFEWALAALKMIEFKSEKPKRKIGF